MYAFTAKYNNKEKATYEQYNLLFDKWAKCGQIQKQIYEKDSIGRLHAHGIISLPPNFFRKKLSDAGLHYKLEEIYNFEGWNKYIMKEQYKVPSKLFPSKERNDGAGRVKVAVVPIPCDETPHLMAHLSKNNIKLFAR